MGDGAGSDLDRRYECDACGKRHASARIIVLPDGTEVGLQSQEYALWCEAKWYLSQKKKVQQDYINRLSDARKDQLRPYVQKQKALASR